MLIKLAVETSFVLNIINLCRTALYILRSVKALLLPLLHQLNSRATGGDNSSIILLMVCLKTAPPIETRHLIWQEKVNNVNDAIQSDQTINNSSITCRVLDTLSLTNIFIFIESFSVFSSWSRASIVCMGRLISFGRSVSSSYSFK